MRREHNTKKLSLIIVLATLILFSTISIAMAVTLPLKEWGANNTADVKLLQQSLNTYKNYNLAVDGIFGPATLGAVKDFQSSNSLVVDGIVGTQTWSKLSSAVGITANNSTSSFWQNKSTWLHPLKGLQTYIPANSFGAPRANGRAHAAIDFIAPSGRLVYAMTDGKVIRTSLFFQNTYAVEVQNTDGTIARYCELAPFVSVNTIVHRGDVIGKIITNYSGTSMLHLEMYKGTTSGSLTQTGNSSNYWYVTVRNYQRRADLIDPTGAKNLPIK
jgi:peptidoglycan hydrolase-like protein with peptidoglycan-binding domain